MNKYQHPRDQPRNFKFEYGDSQKYGIIKNLKEIITYVQTNGKPFVRHRRFKFEYGDSQKYGIIKNLKEIITYVQTNGKPFVRHRRYNGEINEADIHEMSMEDVCLLTQAPEDKVYEALVIGDYIEETSA